MARVDVDLYRKQYLSAVEKELVAKKSGIPNFTSENLHRAIMSEMNRADAETWEVEVPDDRDRAIKEATERCVSFMKTHTDLGVGKTF